MVEGQFLIDLAEAGGIMPRWQDLPVGARITPERASQLRRAFVGKQRDKWDPTGAGLPCLVLSYPWLDPFHPDIHGVLLRRIVPTLKWMLKQVHATGGEHATVGVMLDYCSAPQMPRTPVEQGRFENCLHNMHRWYAHPNTFVLICDDQVQHALNEASGATPSYSNPLHYHERGWCHIERRVASMTKSSYCLFTLSNPPASEYDLSRHGNKHIGRKPPMAPDKIEREVREMVAVGTLSFSYAADLEPVIELYRQGFVSAFQERHLLFADLGWGEAEFAELAVALKYLLSRGEITRTLEIDLHGNHCSSGSRHAALVALEEEYGRLLEIEYEQESYGERMG